MFYVLLVVLLQKAHAQCNIPQTWWQYARGLTSLACAKVSTSEYPLCMIMQDKQISPPSRVCEQ